MKETPRFDQTKPNEKDKAENKEGQLNEKSRHNLDLETQETVETPKEEELKVSSRKPVSDRAKDNLQKKIKEVKNERRWSFIGNIVNDEATPALFHDPALFYNDNDKDRSEGVIRQE